MFLKSKHAFHESQSFTRDEYRFQEMLHPFTKRGSIVDTPTGRRCLQSVRISKRPNRKKRIHQLQGTNELRRFHLGHQSLVRVTHVHERRRERALTRFKMNV